MPRRLPNAKAGAKKQAPDGTFGAVGGSSQRSIKDMFGNIAGGTSQVLRSIREQLTTSIREEDDTQRNAKGAKQVNGPNRKSAIDGKARERTKEAGSRVSRRSKTDKMDKSMHSRRGLRSGVAQSGRVPQARGKMHQTAHYRGQTRMAIQLPLGLQVT
jgi:hypothetical protein